MKIDIAALGEFCFVDTRVPDDLARAFFCAFHTAHAFFIIEYRQVVDHGDRIVFAAFCANATADAAHLAVVADRFAF